MRARERKSGKPLIEAEKMHCVNGRLVNMQLYKQVKIMYRYKVIYIFP